MIAICFKNSLNLKIGYLANGYIYRKLCKISAMMNGFYLITHTYLSSMKRGSKRSKTFDFRSVQKLYHYKSTLYMRRFKTVTLPSYFKWMAIGEVGHYGRIGVHHARTVPEAEVENVMTPNPTMEE